MPSPTARITVTSFRSVRDPVFHLSALRVGEGIEVKLRDQGAGLNRERIEAIARQRNFQPEADQELWDVLLEQDVSTASGVSQTSGRGIGLAAIQRALKTCGGRVHIRPCVEGPGTELTMEFPGGPLRASA
jgi:two-component system chemotaxis sensor kinase CheA